MAGSEDLINFDVIEAQKENIQALPSGRSAKKLAELYSPSPLHKLSTPTPSDTKNINDCIRAEYEEELANISEVDDPLDVYDRYVRWILDAYPSAQATPQSQLHTVLERATKAFINTPQYKNDPRYMKLWLHYIHFFSDAPRETYIFLSRHGIGENMALFYEEYAAWLESAGRFAQAEEVYKLGIERDARPQQRLIRKFGEFEQRRSQQTDPDLDTPSSPALPTIRPALAAKIDPFGAAAAVAQDPQAPRPNHGVGGAASKAKKSKLAIFSDADAAPPAVSSMAAGSKGWESIGSLADRKKENVMQAKPWAGETLQAGGRKASSKMAVFRDASLLSQLSNSHIVILSSKHQVTVNPASGKKERIFVDLRAVYPTPEEPGTELSFEDIWAAKCGYLDQVWDDEALVGESHGYVDENAAVNRLAKVMSNKLVVHKDVVMLDENGALRDPPRESKPRKKKMMEVNETQIIKAKLDSPSGPKIRKKGSSEPTMTMYTRAATDDIYEIFNQPIKPVVDQQDESADEDDYETDGDYTSGAESTGTTRNVAISETGDDADEDDVRVEETSDVKSVSEWSDFSTRKHIPELGHQDEQGHTQSSELLDPAEPEPFSPMSNLVEGDEEEVEDELPAFSTTPEELPRTRTSFIPIPPEDYEPPTRPYRDPAEVANNRLPFMTPITERTETSINFSSDSSSQPYDAKTPSKKYGPDTIPEESFSDLESLSSPLREVINDVLGKDKIHQPLLKKPVGSFKSAAVIVPPPKGPIIKDLQCNPVDEAVRSEILEKIHPPLTSYEGFYDHRQEKYENGSEIRKFAKSLSKAIKNGDRTSSICAALVEFPDTERKYRLRKELGSGAFAPVYLVENCLPDDEDEEDEDAAVMMGKGKFAISHSRRNVLEALKMEDPPTAWEFHMMRLVHSRLGPQHRVAASLSVALELHLYQDECFLFLPYHPYGTLLDVVNLFRAEASGVMDETLAMFFTIELFRTVEALHARQILHGDLKADNCLLRLDALLPSSAAPEPDHQSPPPPQQQQLSSQWRPDGSGGWAGRGVTLIDFGRGIDMRAFAPEAQFIADWRTTAQDCAEMREGRPWTWQIDYHGLAGIVHCLLFGRYIETARCDAGGLGTQAGRRYRVREGLKRYWQADLWGDCFDLLLNPASHVGAEDGARMPVLRSMRAVRERMEAWLEANCERGVGLRSLMAKVEHFAKSRK